MLIFLTINLLHTGIQAQNEPVFDIKNPGGDKAKKCKDYFEVMNNMPAEMRYTVTERDRAIYLVFSHRDYFDLIFNHKADGFAIDIIHKNQYRCGEGNRHANSWAYKGKLMPPMYKETFTPLIQKAPNGMIAINYGTLPEAYDPKEVEYNLLIIQKNWLCENRYFYDLDFDTWSLLPMGLYRDSTENKEVVAFQEIQKTMAFNVPFEKDQTVFQEADVQPIRDSLNLTDYVIKSIDIKAYSSVEGPLDRNIRLQEGRAESIVDILKGYQNESLQSNISASENWQEFNEDIKGTSYENMGDMTQEEVKKQLSADKKLLTDLEPILSKHRKAEISIALEKRVNPKTGDPAILKRLFAESIEAQKIEQALYLQQLAFERINSKELPESFLGELTVPESAIYGSLLSAKASHLVEQQPEDLTMAALAFEKLVKLMPDNEEVLHNLTVVRLRQWAKSEQEINRRDIQNLINKVERSGIPEDLARTLKVNYHIVLTKYLNDEGNYAAKNRSLRYIFNEYRRVDLPDEQLLKLAKYMTHYSQFDWARTLLKPRAAHAEASTDLVFYYLNLTIADPRNTRRPDYQKVMDTAAQRDQSRFCRLFKAKPQGGVTFQLLDDANLKRKFCQVCSSTDDDLEDIEKSRN